MMQEHHQQSTSGGKLGALARILKKKKLKKACHANILGRTLIKEPLYCF
jgi:hypothetical protein